MALTFKKLREGILAQLNPFDNGKTFDTVSRGVQPTPSSQRQATAFNQPTQQVSFNGPQQNFQQQSAPKPTSFSQPSKPAVSFIQPTAQVNIPSYGSNPFKQIVNRTRDYFDANTPQDYAKRNAEITAPTAPNLTYKQQQESKGISGGSIANNPLQRFGVVSKGFGNMMAASPRTFGTGLAQGFSPDVQKANRAQLNSIDQTTQLAHDMANLYRTTPDQATRDRALKAYNSISNNQLENTANLQGRVNQQIKDTDPLKMGASVADMGLTATTFGVGGATRAGVKGASTAAKLAGKSGLRAGLSEFGAQTALAGGLGSTQGALGTVAQQGKDAKWQDVAKGAAMGGVMGAALPTIGYGAGAGLSKLKPLYRKANQLGSLNIDPTQPTIINPLTGKEIPNPAYVAAQRKASVDPLGGAPIEKTPTYYHGTQAPIDKIDQLDEMSGRMNSLFGPGIYLTDNKNIATGYAGSRGTNATAGKVLEGGIGDAKLYNLEDTLQKDVADIFQKKANSLVDYPEDLPDFSKLKGVDAIRELKKYLPDSETYDDFFTQELHPYMKNKGYDGFSHIGGVQGGEKHNVAILFDNKKLAPKSAPIEKTPTSKLKNDELYSAANADVSFGVSGGGKVVRYKPDGTDGVAKDISYDKLSTKTRKELIDAENELEVAKSNSTGPSAPNVITPVIRAKNRLRQAQSNAIEELGLQDYATIETLSAKADGTITTVQKTKNDRFNDWLEQKYNEETNPIAQLTLARDMTANPQKYKAQFEAESSTPVTAPIEKTPTPKVEAPAVDPTAALKQEALKYKSADEFINSQSIHHGTTAPIDKLSIEHANTFEPTLNRGIYTTADKSVADTYANRNGVQGKVFSYKKPESGEVFDYHNDASLQKAGIKLPDVYKSKSAYNTYMNRVMDSKGINYADNLQAARENAVFDQLAIRALKNMGDANPARTWEEIKNTPVSQMASNLDDTATKVLDQINTDLHNQGFDFAKHIGGTRTGNKIHDVYIALHDNALQPQDTKQLTDLYNQAHTQPTPKVEAPKGAPIEKTQLTPREEINQINRKAAQRGDKYTMSEEKRLAELQDQINTAPPVEKKSIDMTVEDWMQKGYTREQAERTVAEKQMTKKLNDEYAGKKYNEGRNSEIVSDEDLRTDKSKAGQRIIQSVQGYKEYTDPNGNKQLRLKVNTATVDHTPESLNKRITELEKQKTFYDGELAPDLEKELQDLYSQKNKSTPVSAPIEKTPTLKVKPTPKAKVSLKQEVPTSPQKNVVSSTNNSTKPNVVKSGKPVVAAKNGIVQGVKRALSDQDQVILDELRNIEKTTGQKGLVDKFMYNSNMQRGSNQIANVNIGKSQNLQSAFGGMSKKTYVRFNEYANARTELAMAGDKTKLSAPKEALAKSVANGHDEFSANFDALNAHYKELATFLHDNGVITDKRFKEFVSNNDYIRIQRDMEDLNPSSFGKGNGYSLNSTITSQKRKGSERAILPAGETAAHYTQQVYKEVYRNKTGTQLVDTLSQHGLAKKLKDAAAARNRNVVTIRRNGKPEYYEVSPEMKQAMDNINPYHMNAVMQILSAPGRVLRAGVTGLNPVFIARNLVKDQAGSAINSEHLLSTHNPRSFFSGLFNAGKDSVGLNNDPLYADFLKHYGDTTSYDITRNAKDANKIVNQIRGGTKVKVGQALKNPIRAAENLAAITEKSTRFQNYRGEYLKAIGSGLSPADASERAAIAAWQNSVDFSRAGTWGRAINTVIPYWNPATQGVRQMGRTVTKHPIKSVLTATAVVGVPIVASTAWNLSSPENKTIYDNIPESEKDNNIILIPPDTTQNQDGTYDVIKIPLPPGYKDAFMPLRRMLEAYAKDKPLEANKIAQDILQTVSGPIQTQTMAQFAGSFIPQAVKPLVQQYANKDMFSGKPIVPDYIDNATDADGNPIPNNKKTYTDKVDGKTVATGSGTAQIIGDRLGVSPIRVEKFIKDTAGTVGLNALRSADWQLSKIGVVPKERIGGQSVIQGLKKSFGQSQGIENANASDGSKYYKNQQKATSNLTGNEKAAFDTLHPSKTNFLGEDIFDEKKRISSYTKASAYLQYPKVWEADKKLNDLQKQAGNPSNPLYDLPEDQARRVLLKATLPPGAKDPELSNLYQKEWYQDYKIKTDKYYQEIAASLAKDGKTIPKTDNPYPTASPELQKAMDAYSALPKGTGARSDWIRANQATFNAMTQQWAANDAWQNKERVAMGLSPIDNTADASNSYGGYGGYGGYSKYGYSRSGGGGGGGGSSDSTGGIGNPYKYAVATSDGPAKTTVKIPGGSATKVGVARKAIAKPKVSLKKSIA